MLAIKDKWDQKYAGRSGPIGPPENFLVQHERALVPGSILDFASGDGRNAIYLSKQGLSVSAADISRIGLERLAALAKEEGLEIPTIESDLSDTDSLSKIDRFNNLLLIRYKPEDEIWKAIDRLLITGGILLVCTFNEVHASKNKFNPEYCLKEHELLKHFPEYELLHLERYEENGAFLDGYVMQKATL